MMTNIQHLDYDALNTLKEVMEDDFVLLVNTFLNDSNQRIATLRSLLNSSHADADAIRRAAHSFKGSCSNLGALHLVSLCGALEHKGQVQNVSAIAADVNAIEIEFAIIQKMLTSYLQ
jgi:histidine phosphotransfer protein HptB